MPSPHFIQFYRIWIGNKQITRTPCAWDAAVLLANKVYADKIEQLYFDTFNKTTELQKIYGRNPINSTQWILVNVF